MDLESLKRLAIAASMYQLDLSPGFLTLEKVEPEADPPWVLAWYRSPYAAAGTMVEGKLNGATAVKATEFAAAASLFYAGDTEVNLHTTGSYLSIKSARRSIRLKVYAHYETNALATMNAIADQCKEGASAIVSDIMSEALVAASMAAPKTNSGILTGLRFRAQGDKIVMQAGNGTSVYQSIVRATVTKPIDIIVPAEDLTTAMKLVGRGGEAIDFSATQRNLSFVTATSSVRIPALSGEWPQLTKIAQQALSAPITVASASLRKVVAAAKLYGYMTWFAVAPVEGGVVLKTPSMDAGGFEEFVPGQVLGREYHLGLSDIERASKLGPVLEMAFGETAARITVPGTSRILYTLIRKT